MKEYRIIKKYYRNSRTAKVEQYFQVQYMGKVLSIVPPFTKLGWKPVKRLNCGWGDCYREDADFDLEGDARSYLQSLKNPVHEEEVIDLSVAFKKE